MFLFACLKIFSSIQILKKKKSLVHGRTAKLPGAPSLFGQAGEVLGDLPKQGKALFF